MELEIQLAKDPAVAGTLSLRLSPGRVSVLPDVDFALFKASACSPTAVDQGWDVETLKAVCFVGRGGRPVRPLDEQAKAAFHAKWAAQTKKALKKRARKAELKKLLAITASGSDSVNPVAVRAERLDAELDALDAELEGFEAFAAVLRRAERDLAKDVNSSVTSVLDEFDARELDLDEDLRRHLAVLRGLGLTIMVAQGLVSKKTQRRLEGFLFEDEIIVFAD